MYSFGKLLGLTLLSLVAASIISSHKAFAADCDMLVPTNAGSVAANCHNYVDQANTSGVSSGAALASALQADLNSGVPANVTSTQWILSRLAPNGNIASLQQALAQPDVTVSVVPLSTVSGNCNDTGYNDVTNSVEQFTQCDAGTDSVLLIKQNGKQVFVLRRECGNAIGSVVRLTLDTAPSGSFKVVCNTIGTATLTASISDPQGAPTATAKIGGWTQGGIRNGSSVTVPYNYVEKAGTASLTINNVGPLGSQLNKTITTSFPACNKAPTGSFGAASCNGDTNTYTISATFNDPNGPTAARIIGANGTSYGGTKSGTSATWTISTNSMPRAAFPAKLQVEDYDGGVILSWVTMGSTLKIPNCPPKGSITGTSCTSVQLKVWDPNAPSSGIQYYLSLNGNGQQGPFTYSGGQSGGVITQDISKVSGFDYWIRNQVTLYGVDVDAGGSHIAVQSATLPSICDSLKCSTSDLPATGIVAGETYTFHVNVQIVGPGLVGPKGAQFSSIRVGSLSTSRGYTPASGSAILQNATPDLTFTPPSAGQYTLTWIFSGGEANPASTTCGKSVQVGYAPFFTVEGGDIAAGPGFGSACTPKVNAGIAASNLANQSGIGYYGAGSQLGAFASGTISQFTTDSTNNPLSDKSVSTNGGAVDSPTGLPSALAFGNSSAAPPTSYGGNFNRPNWCAPDYEGAADTGSVGTFNPGSLTSGTFRLTTSTLPSLVIPQGVHITLIATGNVFIGGNITYDTSYSVTGGDVTQVPQFSLLIKGGNIYIGNTVGTLNGFYDTQPNTNGNGGTLYTCASGPGVPYSNDYASCNHQLTIYGAVAAAKLNLGRTWGNLVKTGGVDNSPSERIIYNPELWLGNLTGPVCRTDTSPGCLYQAYTALPPVL
jgi:hypothetical protein